MINDYMKKYDNMLFVAEMYRDKIDKMINKGNYYKMQEMIEFLKAYSAEMAELYVQLHQYHRYLRKVKSIDVIPVTKDSLTDYIFGDHTLSEYVDERLMFAVISKKFRDMLDIFLPELKYRGYVYEIIKGFIPFTHKETMYSFKFKRGKAISIKLINGTPKSFYEDSRELLKIHELKKLGIRRNKFTDEVYIFEVSDMADKKAKENIKPRSYPWREKRKDLDIDSF